MTGPGPLVPVVFAAVVVGVCVVVVVCVVGVVVSVCVVGVGVSVVVVVTVIVADRMSALALALSTRTRGGWKSMTMIKVNASDGQLTTARAPAPEVEMLHGPRVLFLGAIQRVT